MVFEVDSAVMVLARGEMLTACSEEDASGGEGRSGGERRKEFLRMPKGKLDSYGEQKGGTKPPFGRWVDEEICMVGETWVMFAVSEESVEQKSPFKEGL